MDDGAEEDRQDPGPGEAIKQAFASGRAYAEAEIDRQKLRAGVVVSGARDTAILAGIALVLALATVTALLVGLIVALTPLLGAWGATGAVIGGALLVLIVLLLMMRARIRRMIEALGG